MKKITLFVVLSLTCVLLHSQISISQDFENGSQGWDTNLFFTVPIQTCNGTSVRRNLFYSSTEGILESPNVLGQSNGNDIQISFDYKIVDWGTATVPTQPGWGNFQLQFSTNDGATWNSIATIDDTNHNTSNSCETKSYTVSGSTVPIGSDFAFRFYATWASGDYYLYIDDIEIQQDGSQSAPDNDDIENATALDVGGDFSEFSVDGSVLGATNDSQTPTCGNNGPGIWYKFNVPDNGSVKIETGTDNTTNTPGFDSVIEVFSGSMNNLTSLACNDESSDVEVGYSLLELSGLTPGEELYLRVWENGGDETEPFSVSVYNDALSLSEFSLSQVKVYPNPATDILHIESSIKIDSVTILTVVGQKVRFIESTSNVINLPLKGLKSGIYIVLVNIGNTTKTVRVVVN